MIRLFAIACLLIGTPAMAGDVQEGWNRLHAALFKLSALGDHEAAKAQLIQILNEEVDRRLLAETDYWLGRTYWELGEVQEAQQHMRSCLSRLPSAVECLDIIREIELERVAITRVPKVFEFDDSEHGFVHVGDSGGIDVKDGALRWTISRGTRGNERLLIAVDTPNRAPRGLRMVLHTLGAAANIAIFAVDRNGEYFVLGFNALQVKGDVVELDMPLDLFQSQSGDGRLLDVRQLDRIEIGEVTYVVSNQRQLPNPNVILIERFELY